MSFSKPAPTTYLQLDSDSKTIDLIGLLRRICAEFQYQVPSVVGNLAEMEKFESATLNQRVLKLIEKRLETPMVPPNLPWKQPGKQDVTKFLNQLPVNRYVFRMLMDSPYPNVIHCGVNFLGLIANRVTAKDFKYVKTTPEGSPNAANLKKEELRKIYWQLRLKRARIGIATCLGLIMEELKKQKYAGLLLPNGKVVPFEALHTFVMFRFVPKKLSLFEYSLPVGLEEKDNPRIPPEVNELGAAFIFGSEGEQFCFHFVMALNLPEEDDQGNLGRLMIIDPACAQFGMEGANGELLYWGYSEEYVKAFPARDMHFDEDDLPYHPYNHRSDDTLCAGDLDVVKRTLENLNLDSCGYCGDVPRKNEDGETKLKMCSGCDKAYYCDVLCQKMAWKAHKLECKKEPE